jgi:hypothetical protein
MSFIERLQTPKRRVEQAPDKKQQVGLQEPWCMSSKYNYRYSKKYSAAQ